MDLQSKTKAHFEYNPLFEQLVINAPSGTKDRLIGMIAYADYKEEKYLWKEQYRKANEIEVVPSEAVKSFLLNYHESKLNKLRNDAEEMLYVFAETYVKKSEEETYKKALENALIKEVRTNNANVYSRVKSSSSNLLTHFEKAHDGWWVAGLKGALGSAIFAFALLIATVIFTIIRPESNYGRIAQFLVGGEDFIIMHPKDCRLRDVDKENCVSK